MISSSTDHAAINAGGVESEGNRIYTAQEVAANALTKIEEILLEPEPVREVLRRPLKELSQPQ